MSIADRINSMASNLSNAYDGIEYLGVDITGVDKNLQNLSSMLDVVYEGIPKVSDEGTSPSLDGTRVGRLKSTLKASDTTQFSTTGYNILPVTAITRTLNGLTFTVNADNSLTINGTATANTSFSIYNDENGINLNGDYVYYLIGKNNKINLQGELNGSTVAFIPFSSTSEYVAKTYTNSTLTRVFSYISNGTTFNNETFKYMLIQGTDTTKPYEPYTGGIPSPNPDYPQSIHVVKGNNTITISDNNNESTTYPINLPVQNLFDKDNANLLKAYMNAASNTIQTVGATGADFKTLYIGCSPNTTYTISKISGQRFAVAETQTTPAGGVTVSNKIFNNTGTNITITTSASANYLVVFYYLSTADTLTEQQIRDSIQIEPGNKANRYTPYGVAPIELCKTNTYQDKLFKAILGDTIYDSLTAEQKAGLTSGAWYKYGVVQNYILNGRENWDNTYGTNLFHIDIQGKKVNASSLALTNQYLFDDRQYSYQANLPNGKFAIQILQSTTKDALYIKNTDYDNPINFKNSLVNNNLYLYYPLATPTITQITDSTLVSQLENLYKAMSKNGQTNVLQTNADVPFTIYASALKGE